MDVRNPIRAHDPGRIDREHIGVGNRARLAKALVRNVAAEIDNTITTQARRARDILIIERGDRRLQIVQKIYLLPGRHPLGIVFENPHILPLDQRRTVERPGNGKGVVVFVDQEIAGDKSVDLSKIGSSQDAIGLMAADEPAVPNPNIGVLTHPVNSAGGTPHHFARVVGAFPRATLARDLGDLHRHKREIREREDGAQPTG